MTVNSSNADDSSEQVEVRKQKLEKLKALGTAAYPNDFKPTDSPAAIVIGFATTALFLVVLLALRGQTGTDHVDGREPDA